MVNAKKNKKCKYIFVTGGVLSGVGKGITAASMGAILKAKGYKVTMQKCDPYLNVDAGLLNPVEHGECYVTHDGVETDLDLGHYERFLDFETSKYSITLSGSINKELIEKERAGGFHGKTVQLVPHFTNLVQEKKSKKHRKILIFISLKSVVQSAIMRVSHSSKLFVSLQTVLVAETVFISM